MPSVDFTKVTPVAQLVGEDQDDTEQLRKLHAEAEDYLRSLRWCPGIAEALFGTGIGGVVGVFLFRLTRHVDGVEWLWVVVGDLPSAYLVTERAPDPNSALRVYCELMQEWVEAVRNKRSLRDVFPVGAPADEKHAAILASRLRFIREKVIESH